MKALPRTRALPASRPRAVPLLAALSAAFPVWFLSSHLRPILGHILSPVQLRLVASFAKQMSRFQLKIHVYEIPTFAVAFPEPANSEGKFHRLQRSLWCAVSGGGFLSRMSYKDSMECSLSNITEIKSQRQCEITLYRRNTLPFSTFHLAALQY